MNTDPTEGKYNPRGIVTEAVLKKVESVLATRPQDNENTKAGVKLLAELTTGNNRGLEVHFERYLPGRGESSLRAGGKFFVGAADNKGEFGFQDIAGKTDEIPPQEMELRQDLYPVNSALAGDISNNLLSQLSSEHPLETKIFMREEGARQIKQIQEWYEQVSMAMKNDPDFKNNMATAYEPEELLRWIELLKQAQEKLQ